MFDEGLVSVIFRLDTNLIAKGDMLRQNITPAYPEHGLSYCRGPVVIRFGRAELHEVEPVLVAIQ